MHQSAVLGWGLLFVGIAYCAFVVDRDLSIREQRLQAELPEGKRRRSRFPWGVMAGSTLLVGAIGCGAYFSDLMPFALVPLTVHLVLLVLFLIGVNWFLHRPPSREVHLGRKTKHTARSLGFGLRHLMALLTVLGVTAGIVRARYPEAGFDEFVATTIFFTVIVSLFVAIAYLGADTLLFGRGSGRRANRLREIEKRREEEDFS